ncbi:SH3 domain-containing protein [Clostridium sp. SHJSY1]|uniref:SH3 domain-containing protein n=1 Tax=Clostridium sp. SHJSY1 TaxID=2942483 RepID=UPI002874BB8C|nr:SH3 domain-containing protein [Clostridium sp. SHJSY1]MDS0526673.1 SH3 domain-containing protein [Clostridium sp. SHJSY1]
MKKLALALVLFSTLSIGGIATSANAETTKTNQNSTQNVNSLIKSLAQEYGWICTHDGVGVNLRASKSTSSKVLAKIPEGTKVKLLSGVVSGWYKVQYNGQIGYVSASYVVDENGDGPGL